MGLIFDTVFGDLFQTFLDSIVALILGLLGLA